MPRQCEVILPSLRLSYAVSTAGAIHPQAGKAHPSFTLTVTLVHSTNRVHKTSVGMSACAILERLDARLIILRSCDWSNVHLANIEQYKADRSVRLIRWMLTTVCESVYFTSFFQTSVLYPYTSIFLITIDFPSKNARSREARASISL